MRELSHDELTYDGDDGENVSITIIPPPDAPPILNYKLDGATKSLTGNTISFRLTRKPNDTPTVLQLVTDYNSPGSYRLVIRSVENEANDEWVQTLDGPPLRITDITFFVN